MLLWFGAGDAPQISGGFVPERTWTAHGKELFGLAAPGRSPNENPSPLKKLAAIQRAFQHLGLC
jgi:hypothetical protein